MTDNKEDKTETEFTINEIFDDFTTYQSTIEEKISKVDISTIDYDQFQDSYTAWSIEYNGTRRINGKTLQDIKEEYLEEIVKYIKIFSEGIKANNMAGITHEDLVKVHLLIMYKISRANGFYREAKSKYNMSLINSATRYLMIYEDALKDPGVLRNTTRDKIKMIAESKNTNAIVTSMLAKEEMEIYRDIIFMLKDHFAIIKSIAEIKKSDQYLEMASHGNN